MFAHPGHPSHLVSVHLLAWDRKVPILRLEHICVLPGLAVLQANLGPYKTYALFGPRQVLMDTAEEGANSTESDLRERMKQSWRGYCLLAVSDPWLTPQTGVSHQDSGSH